MSFSIDGFYLYVCLKLYTSPQKENMKMQKSTKAYSTIRKLKRMLRIERVYTTQQLLNIVIGPGFGGDQQTRLQKTLDLKLAEAIDINSLIAAEPGQTLLDLGSGFGVLAKYVSERAEKVICCDIYREMLLFAERLNVDRNNIEYVEIKNYDLSPIAENSIDTLYSTGLFIHFNMYDANLYLKEFTRVLKNGGKLVLNIKNENKLEMSQFFHDANIYAKNGYTTKWLQQWMSPQGLAQLAEHYGFTLIKPLTTDTDVWLSFTYKK